MKNFIDRDNKFLCELDGLKLNTVLRRLSDIYFKIDYKGKILDWEIVNPSEFYRKSQFYTGENFRNILPNDISINFNEVLNSLKQTNYVQSIEYSTCYNRVKEYYEAKLVSLKNKTIAIMINNITEKKLNKEKIFKIKRFEYVESITGGFVHNFNNILSIILGNISVCKKSIEEENVVYYKLNEMEKAVVQGQNIIREILDFLQNAKPVKNIIYINNLIEDIVRLSLANYDVSCKFNICKELRKVEVDWSQISQVINNMVTNAAQSMNGKGEIKVSGENVFVKNEPLIPLKQGEYVKISIEDYGCGISDENISKIFKPYFTTKSNGNGLGLFISYTMIKKNGGYINVKSKLGKGTTFEIYLPASKNYQVEYVNEDSKIISNRGQVLIMDDMKEIRDILGEMLENIGYNVQLASDGDETIEIYKQSLIGKNKFDAVIMDLSIPKGKGGKETIQELLRMDSNVKGIVSSGYYNKPEIINFREYGFKGAIIKPYTISKLSKVLNDVINE